jgi:hypothetical protein
MDIAGCEFRPCQDFPTQATDRDRNLMRELGSSCRHGGSWPGVAGDRRGRGLLDELPRLVRHTSRPALSRCWAGLAHCCAELVKLAADVVPNDQRSRLSSAITGFCIYGRRRDWPKPWHITCAAIHDPWRRVPAGTAMAPILRIEIP